MTQMDNQKFGEFVAELRKEKRMTQKELAAQLFVSDKAVSKWERGQSMPGVELLIPLAEILGVTVTELLKGEHIREEKQMDIREVEILVTRSVQLTVEERNASKARRLKWAKIYPVCLLTAVAECLLFWKLDLISMGMKTGLWTVELLMFFFGAWFCFILREKLPAYYDENRINFVAQNGFRMNMPGIRFNNGNWPHIMEAGARWSLAVGVLYPLVGVLLGLLFGPEDWIFSGIGLTITVCFSIFIPIYWAGKKYQ